MRSFVAAMGLVVMLGTDGVAEQPISDTGHELFLEVFRAIEDADMWDKYLGMRNAEYFKFDAKVNLFDKKELDSMVAMARGDLQSRYRVYKALLECQHFIDSSVDEADHALRRAALNLQYRTLRFGWYELHSAHRRSIHNAVMRWTYETGELPPPLSELGNNPTYFPEGVPIHPVENRPYVLDPNVQWAR